MLYISANRRRIFKENLGEAGNRGKARRAAVAVPGAPHTPNCYDFTGRRPSGPLSGGSLVKSDSTRRRFLESAAALAAWGAGCAPSAPPEEPAPEPAAVPRMKLSLSARVAESFSNKREASLNIHELIALAQEIGYDALCMRASQVGVHSPPEKVTEISEAIRAAGLVVSMATGDFYVPQNDNNGPDGLRNITPYLDLAESFGAPLIRICMKRDEDIEWVQRASDEAAERNIRLAHQSHNSSLFETVEGSLRVLKAVGRENFGIIYEPANWFIAGEQYGKHGIEAVRDYIFNVYVQNHKLNPEAESAVNTWGKGPVPIDHIGVWEPGGVNFEEMFETLHGIGYSGYVTVHQAFAGIMSVEEAVRKSYDYLKPLSV